MILGLVIGYAHEQRVSTSPGAPTPSGTAATGKQINRPSPSALCRAEEMLEETRVGPCQRLVRGDGVARYCSICDMREPLGRTVIVPQ